MTTCPYCQEEVADNATFCTECRKIIDTGKRGVSSRISRDMAKLRVQESSPNSDLISTGGSDRIEPAWLEQWFKSFQEEQRKQTDYLKDISTFATIIGLLILLSMAIGFCSVIV